MANQVVGIVELHFFASLPRRDIRWAKEKLFHKCLSMSTDRTYIRKPQPYRIPENQSHEAKEKYLQCRTRELKAFLLGCFPEDLDTASIQSNVIGQVARSYKLVCF